MESIEGKTARGRTYVRRNPEVRFWQKVDKQGPVPAYAPHLGPCWLWLASHNGHGYGQFKVVPAHAAVGAHRWSYEQLVGPIPEGLTLDHLCRVRLCVNPLHLEPVTMEENLRREFEAVTHCVAGHEFTPENTKMYRGKHRRCIACSRQVAKDRWAAMTPEDREARRAKRRADYAASK